MMGWVTRGGAAARERVKPGGREWGISDFGFWISDWGMVTTEGRWEEAGIWVEGSGGRSAAGRAVAARRGKRSRRIRGVRRWGA
jgi:hypothetical protein